MFALIFALATHLPPSSQNVQTTRELAAAGGTDARPAAANVEPVRTMHCGAPRPLVQGSGTVRLCR